MTTLIITDEMQREQSERLAASMAGLEASIDRLLEQRDEAFALLRAIVHEYDQTHDAEQHPDGRWTHAASISTELMQSASRLVSGCKPTRHIDFVFSGHAPNMTLVEVENDKGRSFLAGEWLAPINGLTVLRIRPDCFEKGGAA